MKTLKKTLCLVLAVVMVVGVLIIPANAAGTTAAADAETAAQEKYAEALAVLNGLGIMTGDEDGYRANDTITRQEAAAVVARLKETDEVAKAYPTGSLNFADCKGADVWGKSYIAYVNDKKIANGDEAGFRPNDPVTGYEFAKMVLVALGYDPAIEQFKDVGDAWTGNVYSVARRIKLTQGVTISNAPIKRGEVAQMAFNALFLNQVYYTGGTEIEINGATIRQGATLMGEDREDDENTLATQVHLLTPDEDVDPDDFGRPNDYSWVTPTDVLYTSESNPLAVITAKTADGKYTEDGDEAKGLSLDTSLKINVDGVDQASAAYNTSNSTIDAVITKAYDDAATKGASVAIELYGDAATKKVNNFVIVYTYADVVKTVTAAQGTTKASITLTNNGSVKGTDVTGYKVGDVIIYTQAKNAIAEHAPAQAVKGTMTSYSTSKKYTVNTVEYEASEIKVDSYDLDASAATLLGKASIYYLDAAGKVVYVTDDKGGTASQSTNYAIIVASNVVKTEAVFPATTDTYTVQVQAILSDGTIGIYDMAVSDDGKIEIGGGKDAVTGESKADTPIELSKKVGRNKLTELNSVYAYDLSGTTISLTALPALDGTAEKVSVVGVKSAVEVERKLVIENGVTTGKDIIQNDKTVYVTYKDNKPVVRTGYTSLTDKKTLSSSTVVLSFDKDTGSYVALVVFCNGEFGSADPTATKNYVYLTGTKSTSLAADGSKVYTYEVFTAAGVKDSIVTTTESLKAGIYELKSDGSVDETPKMSKSDQVGDIIGGAVTKLGENYYDISDAVIVDTTGKNVTALAKDQYVMFVADGTTVSLIFVLAAAVTA